MSGRVIECIMDQSMNVLTSPSLDTLRWFLNGRISSVAIMLS